MRSYSFGMFLLLLFSGIILDCSAAAAVTATKTTETKARVVEENEQKQQKRKSITDSARSLRATFSSSVSSSKNKPSKNEQLERNLVIGGHTAMRDRYPYYVALLDANEEVQCGGTLIAPDVVLTAAHCRGSKLKWALVGKYSNLEDDGHERIMIMNPLERVNDFSVFSQLQESNMTELSSAGFLHPDHDLDARTYDVMLMKLEYESNSSHRPFMKINADKNLPAKKISGNEITVIGMGNTDVSGLVDKPDVLQQVHLDYLSYEECVDAEGYNLDYKFELLPHMICTMGEGVYGNRGQCYGDSGGPYIVLGETPEEDVQVGVISWAVNCASSVFPMVGSRTSESIDFIKGVTCAIALNAPPELCSIDASLTLANNNGSGVQGRVDGQDAVPISVRIYTDPYGHELKWSIKDQLDPTKVYADVPYGTIVGDHSFKDVSVPAGSNLRFEINDAADDGIFGDADAILYEIVLIDPQRGSETVILEGNGQFGTTRQVDFHVPFANEYIPDFSSRDPFFEEAAIAIDRAQSKPSCMTVPMFINIEFDDYHEDASWQVTSLDEQTVYASKAPGTYRYGNEVKEQIDLCPGSYKFTITDRRGQDEYRAFKKYKLTYRGLTRVSSEVPLYESQSPFYGERISHDFEIPVLGGGGTGNDFSLPAIIFEDPQQTENLSRTCLQGRAQCTSNEQCCSRVCLVKMCTGENGTSRGGSLSSRNSLRNQGSHRRQHRGGAGGYSRRRL